MEVQLYICKHGTYGQQLGWRIRMLGLPSATARSVVPTLPMFLLLLLLLLPAGAEDAGVS
jgi:hypothetical protein